MSLVILCHSAALEEKIEREKRKKQRSNNNRNKCINKLIDLDSESDSESSSPDETDGDYDEEEKCSTVVQLPLYLNDRLITVKKMIEKEFSIALNYQILVYKDKILRNDLKQLHEFGLNSNSRVHVFDKRDIKEDQNEDRHVLSRAEIYGIYQQHENNINSTTNTRSGSSDRFRTEPARNNRLEEDQSMARRKYKTMKPERVYERADVMKKPSMSTRNTRNDQFYYPNIPKDSSNYHHYATAKTLNQAYPVYSRFNGIYDRRY
jgi:hypothetical protein